MRIGIFISIILWSALLWALSGCSSSTGWGFAINAYPIHQVDNRQQAIAREADSGKVLTTTGRRS